MPPTLTGERLILRPILGSDTADLHAIYSDERAMIYMPSEPHTTLEQTLHHLETAEQSPGAVAWAICLKEDERVIGKVNYLGQTRVPGMGYILHPDYWGQGITTEACRLALDYGFDVIGYDRVELWIDETNAASNRVAQKLGFIPRGRIPHKYSKNDRHHMMLVWGMLAADWRGERRDDSDHVELYNAEPVLMVHDVVATAEYYRDKLGFRIDFLYGDPPNHGGVSSGGWTGSMISIQLSQVPPERAIQPAGYLHIRTGSNIDKLYKQYRDAGVEIVAAPDNKPWGFREFTIRDMNGHHMIFATLL